VYDRAFYAEYGTANEAYRRACHAVAEEIHRLARPVTVVDWGCGAGLHSERLRDLGCAVTSIDGSLAPDDLRAPGIEIQLHDLSEPRSGRLLPGSVDLAICLDVLEHVDPSAEGVALANVVHGARCVILSCAPPGQRGIGHVNERPRRHWIEKMRVLGFQYDRRATARLEARVRARPEDLPGWMYRHLVVYRREGSPGEDARFSPSLQKGLQGAGLSKREARAAIREGRVAMDGVVETRFAALVPDGAAVTLDGSPVHAAAPVWYLLHKPRKHLSTLEPGREDGLARYLPADAPRLFLVGRLDYGSEGAILLTNDGVLARRVLDPRFAVPRTYRVKVRDRLPPEHPAIASMARPIRIGGRVVQASEVAFEAHRTRATWIRVVLVEGAHHEVRALCRRARLQIVKLRREAVGPIRLGDLNPRCVRPLGAAELEALRDCTDGHTKTSLDSA